MADLPIGGKPIRSRLGASKAEIQLSLLKQKIDHHDNTTQTHHVRHHISPHRTCFTARPIAIPNPPAIIYSDTFSGTAALNGTAPDTAVTLAGGSSSALWVAGDATEASGSLGITGNGYAFLPFTPVSGNVYTLTLNVAITDGGGNHILAGFDDGPAEINQGGFSLTSGALVADLYTCWGSGGGFEHFE